MDADSGSAVLAGAYSSASGAARVMDVWLVAAYRVIDFRRAYRSGSTPVGLMSRNTTLCDLPCARLSQIAVHTTEHDPPEFVDTIWSLPLSPKHMSMSAQPQQLPTTNRLPLRGRNTTSPRPLSMRLSKRHITQR